MKLKHLVMAVLFLIVAVVGVTYVMISKIGRPPTGGEMAEFKPLGKPQPVAAGSFADEKGAVHNLAEFKGKVTLVNFWATWCTPCVRELPSLDALKRARDGADFQVVTISEDHGGEVAVTDFFKRAGVGSLPHYVDSEATYGSLLKFQSLPTTMLLDAEGNEIGRYDSGGADWNSGDAWRLIQFYIDKGKKPAS